ncbi:MAG TPA: outer membrane beta-barrel protein [Bryobacteraceae bacterium]|nr:outer membrane beta-barrel protein [Bryobacteraceae bacterium]
MSKRMSLWSKIICVGLGLAALLPGQSESDFHRFTFAGGAGFTAITGFDAGRLDHGGNLLAGAGVNFNRYFGVTGNFMFNQLGITRSELDALNQPDGSARVYSLTVDPTVTFPIKRNIGAYLLGGGGYFRRTVEFTQPTLAQTFVFNPWWGYIGPGLIPVNQILGSVTSNSGAFDVGGGVNFGLPKTGARLFLESRYFHGFTSNSNTTLVPLTFGIRW